jgi:hypothetical protein
MHVEVCTYLVQGISDALHEWLKVRKDGLRVFMIKKVGPGKCQHNVYGSQKKELSSIGGHPAPSQPTTIFVEILQVSCQLQMVVFLLIFTVFVYQLWRDANRRSFNHFILSTKCILVASRTCLVFNAFLLFLRVHTRLVQNLMPAYRNSQETGFGS